MKVTRLIAAVGLCAAASAPLAAHHSAAMFDDEKVVELNGTIKEVQWTNPHIWVQVMAKDPRGTAGPEVEWSIEGGSPNGLSRRGWTRNAMKAGDKVTVVIHPLKNGEHGGSLMNITVNGKTLGQG